MAVDSIESGLLQTIHTEDPLISGFGEILNMKQVHQSFFYDTFALDFENSRKMIKISYITGTDSIGMEKIAISNLPTGVSGLSLVSPTVISSNTGELPHYLCTTFENGYSFEDFDSDDLNYNLGTFCNTLDTIHESSVDNLPTLSDMHDIHASVVGFIEEDIDIESNMVTYFGFSAFDIENILKKNKEFIDQNYTVSTNVFSHFDIKKSSILYRDDMIKIINFENSYCLDLFTSLQKTAYNLNFNYAKNYLINFLKKYFKSSDIVSSFNEKTFIAKYFEKEKVNALIIANDLISRHLFLIATEGLSDLEKFYQNYEIYKQVKPFLLEMHPEHTESFQQMFMYMFPNYVEKERQYEEIEEA